MSSRGHARALYFSSSLSFPHSIVQVRVLPTTPTDCFGRFSRKGLKIHATSVSFVAWFLPRSVHIQTSNQLDQIAIKWPRVLHRN